MQRRSLAAVAGAVVLSACAAFRAPPADGPRVRCLRAGPTFDDPLAAGRRFATREEQRIWHLAAFDSADVQLVADPAICARVSRALGPVPPGPSTTGRPRPRYSDVVVVRLGGSGYLVASPWQITHAGEFLCDRALMSADFRDIRRLCG